MLRSNRKNSPANGANGIRNTTLPYYSSQDSVNSCHSNISSCSNGAIPKRRRKHGTASSSSWCSKWTLLFITFSCLGSFLMVKRNETAAHHFHKAIKTFADPTNTNVNNNNNNPSVQRRAAATPILPPQPPHNGLYDVVILGTGPAGLTAALFAARAGLSVLVFGSDSGSLSETHQLENFPSWQLLTDGSEEGGGPLWLQTTKQQAAQWGATFAQAGLLVDQLHVSQQGDSTTFGLEMNRGSLQAKARSVIVATGATGRRLGLPSENDLWGKSVHSCAVCDGSSYVHKIVVVVGGGDAAIDGALLLARYAKQVILVHRRTDFRASNSRNLELLKTTSNIRLEMPAIVGKLETTKSKNRNPTTKEYNLQLTAVHVHHTETAATQRIACDGVFELIGSTPNTDWLKGSNAQLDEGGFLVLSNNQGESKRATSLEGVFAAGEVTDQIYRQAITAAAEGAESAMDAERWLRNHPAPQQHAKQQRHASIPLQTVLVQDNNNIPAAAIRPDEAPPDQPPEEEDDYCDLVEEECIRKTVAKYPVVVFSKPWCPYCRKALEALAAEGLPEGHANLHVVDLSLLGKKTQLVQGTLQSMTGRRTVPNVFVGGTSIGGGDETSQFHRQGKLRGMLVRAKAIDEGGQENSRCDDLTQEACITQLVNQYPVVVFSKPGCPHCRKAFEALALEGVPKQSRNLHVVDLGPMANRAQIQDRLEIMTGRRTVPNVFLGGNSIGGGSETVQFQRNGELRAILAKVHAIEQASR